jgi:hypothetical protein
MIQTYYGEIWTENENGQDYGREDFKELRQKRRTKVNDTVTKRWKNLFIYFGNEIN